MSAPSSPIERLRELVDEAPILGGKPMVDPADLAYVLALLDRCRETLAPFADADADRMPMGWGPYFRAAHALHAELSPSDEEKTR